ncbi:MAG: flagellar basal body protein, partial [Parahaliea sp.]
MADIRNIGASALLSLQRALSTTGNNIANANTEGYSRQEVIFATNPTETWGGMEFGTGVRIAGI